MKPESQTCSKYREHLSAADSAIGQVFLCLRDDHCDLPIRNKLDNHFTNLVFWILHEMDMMKP